MHAMLAKRIMTMVDKEKKKQVKRDLKIVIASVAGTLLFIIIILLLVIFGLKNCSKKDNNHGSSSNISSSQKYDFDNAKLDEAFKYLVNKQIQIDGFEGTSDYLGAVTYVDDYPNTFNLSISGFNDNKVYFLEITNCSYLGDKNGYDNVISYLLLNNNYQSLDAAINLTVLDTSNSDINTSKTTAGYVVGIGPTNDKYLTGSYFENSQYHVYFKKHAEDGVDPFIDNADMIVSSGSLLYGYYQTKLSA